MTDQSDADQLAALTSYGQLTRAHVLMCEFWQWWDREGSAPDAALQQFADEAHAMTGSDT